MSVADQDDLSGLPDGPIDDDSMPVFVIKAKDRLAVAAVRYYGELCVEAGLTGQSREVAKALAEIVSWRSRHRDLIQMPDHPHVPIGSE